MTRFTVKRYDAAPRSLGGQRISRHHEDSDYGAEAATVLALSCNFALHPDSRYGPRGSSLGEDPAR